MSIRLMNRRGGAVHKKGAMMNIDGTARLCIAALPPGLAGQFPEVTGHSVVISRRVVENQKLSSAPVKMLEEVFWKRNRDFLTNDLPIVSDLRAHLDPRGIAQRGSLIHHGEVLIGKARPETSHPTSDEKLRHAIFGKKSREDLKDESLWKDESLRYPYRDPGRIIHTQILARNSFRCDHCGDIPDLVKEELQPSQPCPYCEGKLQQHSETVPYGADACARVVFSIWRELQVGDVLRDEQGQFYTVARIVDADQMPYTKSKPWRKIDLLVHHDAPVLNTLERIENIWHPVLKGKGSPWKNQLMKSDWVQWKKITQLYEDSLTVRGQGKYDFCTQLPTTGLLDGPPAQTITAEAAEALLQQGYASCLCEMLTLKSDDVDGRREVDKAIIAGTAFTTGPIRSVLHFVFQLRTAGIVVTFPTKDLPHLPENALAFRLASPHDIRGWSFGEVKKSTTYDDRTFRPERDGLFCERIFGPEKDGECACGKYRGMKYKGMICDRCDVKVTHSRVRFKRMGHIELAVEVIHPWALYESDYLSGQIDLTRDQLQQISEYELVLVTTDETNPSRKGTLISKTELLTLQQDHKLQYLEGSQAVRELMKLHDVLNLDPLLLSCLPVMPPGFRDVRLNLSNQLTFPKITDSYRTVLNRNNKLKKLIELNAPEVIVCNEKRMLQKSVNILLCNTKLAQPQLNSQEQPIRSLADDLQKSQRNLLDKTVDYSACGVSIANTKVQPGQIGLPAWAIQRLYEPWLIRCLQELKKVETITAAKRLLEQELPEPLESELFRAVIGDQLVLVMTADHRAFPLQPVCIPGEVFGLHPSQGEQLGLNFSGEKLTVHIPLTESSIQELRKTTPTETRASEVCEWSSEFILQLAAEETEFEFLPLDQIALGMQFFEVV
jgi:hypothetical protein